MIPYTVVTPELVRLSHVMYHICSSGVPYPETPEEIASLLQFKTSAFYDLYHTDWFSFTRLRDTVREAMTDIDGVDLDEDGNVVISFVSNDVNSNTLGILMVLMRDRGWSDLKVSTTGIVKGSIEGKSSWSKYAYELTLIKGA